MKYDRFAQKVSRQRISGFQCIRNIKVKETLKYNDVKEEPE